MAHSDKNIVITPNISSTTADPKIVFSGADASTGAQNITLQVYPTNSGTLSFEGSAGQLFSISNIMTGTIFSANDVSGIPSIEVLDTGLVKIAQYSGNLLIGTGTDSGIAKVQITGDQTVSGKTIYGPNTTWGAYLQVGGSSREYVDNGTYASVAASDGNLHLDAASGKDLYLNYYDGSSVRIGGGANNYVASFNTAGSLTLNGDLTVGNGANNSNIYMYDSDEGTRRIHCNSNRIGFLNQSDGWGAYCDDSGNWYANNISGSTSGTNTGDQTTISGNAGSATYAGYVTGNNQSIVGRIKFYGEGGNSSQAWGAYEMYQESGAWSNPFPDLSINFHTGIKIGAYTGYGGIRFYNNDGASNSTLFGSFGDGDNNFRSYYNIIAYASDRRLKTNIVKIENAIEKVKAINGVTFDWILDKTNTLGFTPARAHEVGVLAQEIEAVLPEAVDIAPFDYDWKAEDGSHSKSGEKYLTVKYEKIVPLLIEAIKEQQTQIEELKKMLMEIKNGI